MAVFPSFAPLRAPVFAPLTASRRSLLRGLAPAAAGIAGLLRPAVAGAPGGAGSVAAVALFVAFDVLAERPAELQRLLHLLADRAAVAADADAALTLAVGGALFDRRFGLARLRPRHLALPAAINAGDVGPAPWHGDLLLQIEAASPGPAAAALRDVVRHTHALLAPRWKVNGFRPRDPDVRARGPLPGVEPGPLGEPAWMQGGSYVEVRKRRYPVERGDADARTDTGALAGDPASVLRHFAYDHGIDEAGQFDMGRISCRYLREPGAWPEAAADMGRERCGGGGLFFVLPGLRETAASFRAALAEATRAPRNLGSG
ncbi:Dyp-type peroxidase domain-containing protein [Lichenicoccus sp.]|uniref:Dyp-type peroxidase domain-containing protein n=1 Tax=Lichenicoccus sp. TaxID=2781899 RepID=UPI003D101959